MNVTLSKSLLSKFSKFAITDHKLVLKILRLQIEAFKSLLKLIRERRVDANKTK